VYLVIGSEIFPSIIHGRGAFGTMASNPLLGKLMGLEIIMCIDSQSSRGFWIGASILVYSSCATALLPPSNCLSLCCTHALGSRISLISKKNIRYEGILYSINEADATVALQDVKSFGTEGRLLDATGFSTFVPPNDQVHAYLLFRGQDIKDLHVHEMLPGVVLPPAPAGAAAVTPPPAAPTAARVDAKPVPPPSQTPASALDSKPTHTENKVEEKKPTATEKRPARSQKQKQQQQQQQQGENTQSKHEQPEATGVGESKEAKPATSKTTSSASAGANRKNQNMVGTGASLLNRNLRGAKGDKGQ
jgi:hypothetical protein